MRIMRALLLGANSKRQPAIHISTELNWLVDIEPSVQGCAVGFVNGRRACRKYRCDKAERRSPNLLSILIHQLRRKLHTTVRVHLNCEQLLISRHDSSIRYIEEQPP